MVRAATISIVLISLLLLSGCVGVSGHDSPGDKGLNPCRQLLVEELSTKSAAKLRDVAAEVRAQRQTLAQVEGFVGWMSKNLSAYVKYLDAGNVVAAIARVLPIPYAGQASLFTKFASSGILSLEKASIAVNHYMGTSQQFIDKVEALGNDMPDQDAIADVVSFADKKLLPDMNDARGKLSRVTEISTSTLAFLQAIHGYAKSTDEYLGKTKAFFLRGNEPQEKGFLSESIEALQLRAESFDSGLKLFNESSQRCEFAVKALVGYGELSKELSRTDNNVKSAPKGVMP